MKFKLIKNNFTVYKLKKYINYAKKELYIKVFMKEVKAFEN